MAAPHDGQAGRVDALGDLVALVDGDAGDAAREREGHVVERVVVVVAHDDPPSAAQAGAGILYARKLDGRAHALGRYPFRLTRRRSRTASTATTPAMNRGSRRRRRSPGRRGRRRGARRRRRRPQAPRAGASRRSRARPAPARRRPARPPAPRSRAPARAALGLGGRATARQHRLEVVGERVDDPRRDVLDDPPTHRGDPPAERDVGGHRALRRRPSPSSAIVTSADAVPWPRASLARARIFAVWASGSRSAISTVPR